MISEHLKRKKKKEKNRLEHLASGWFPSQEFPKSKLDYSVDISGLEHADGWENFAKWTDPAQVARPAARGVERSTSFLGNLPV